MFLPRETWLKRGSKSFEVIPTDLDGPDTLLFLREKLFLYYNFISSLEETMPLPFLYYLLFFTILLTLSYERQDSFSTLNNLVLYIFSLHYLPFFIFPLLKLRTLRWWSHVPVELMFLSLSLVYFLKLKLFHRLL